MLYFELRGLVVVYLGGLTVKAMVKNLKNNLAVTLDVPPDMAQSKKDILQYLAPQLHCRPEEISWPENVIIPVLPGSG